jgi:hypothetical protein
MSDVTSLRKRMPCIWTAEDRLVGEKFTYGNGYGDVAWVASTPFGWVVVWDGGADGLYNTKEAAMSAAEEAIK